MARSPSFFLSIYIQEKSDSTGVARTHTTHSHPPKKQANTRCVHGSRFRAADLVARDEHIAYKDKQEWHERDPKAAPPDGDCTLLVRVQAVELVSDLFQVFLQLVQAVGDLSDLSGARECWDRGHRSRGQGWGCDTGSRGKG